MNSKNAFDKSVTALEHEAIRRISAHGVGIKDFYAVSPDNAPAVVKGTTMTANHVAERLEAVAAPPSPSEFSGGNFVSASSLAVRKRLMLFKIKKPPNDQFGGATRSGTRCNRSAGGNLF
jgi:hypothetical protein